MTGSPGSVLLDICSKARHLFIAAPYIKLDALEKVLVHLRSSVSLICITRWNPGEIMVGVSDTGCRTRVTERGGLFRLHPTLHAKYYRIDDVVLVGSANLTSSAMGWAPRPNLEILCCPSEDFDARGFERDLLNESREINDAEFARWECLGKIDVRNHTEIFSLHPLLDAWRPATRDLRNLELVYRGQKTEIASFDEQRSAQRDIQALSIPPGLTDEAVRAWISTCLLSAPFASSVRRLTGSDPSNAAGSLAETYGLGATAARRDMETVQNWLSFLGLDASTGRM